MKTRMKFSNEDYDALYLYLKLILCITLSSAMSFSKNEKGGGSVFSHAELKDFFPLPSIKITDFC